MQGSTKGPTAGCYQGRHTAPRDATILQFAPRSSEGGDGALPPVLGLAQAAAMLGLGRTTAYRLVAERLWPTPVVRLGRSIKVPTHPLLELLRGAWPPDAIGLEQSMSSPTKASTVVHRG